MEALNKLVDQTIKLYKIKSAPKQACHSIPKHITGLNSIIDQNEIDKYLKDISKYKQKANVIIRKKYSKN